MRAKSFEGAILLASVRHDSMRVYADRDFSVREERAESAELPISLRLLKGLPPLKTLKSSASEKPNHGDLSIP